MALTVTRHRSIEVLLAELTACQSEDEIVAWSYDQTATLPIIFAVFALILAGFLVSAHY